MQAGECFRGWTNEQTFALLNPIIVLRCFYHPDYVFPLPPEHPFPMDKFWRAEEMLRNESNVIIQPSRHASRDELERVHASHYLESIRLGSLAKPEAVRLGLPASAALLERSALEVGGTLLAVEAAQEDSWACNLAGGTHHAFPDRGLGYCVLNDVAVAIRALRAERPDVRCFVIDTDAHQGNGTNGIFSADERVFTYSIHVGKNYPAEKTPGSLDVPLPRFVPGSDYLEQLESTLSPALEDFGPDFVFWIAGADLHTDDRFGQMRLTDDHFAARDHHVLGLIARLSVPAVVLYGGGYNRDRFKTAWLHAETVKRVVAYATASN